MVPNKCGANFGVRKIAVGPVSTTYNTDRARLRDCKSSAKAPMNVTKMPSCAAPPNKRLLGLAINGPKIGHCANTDEYQHG